MARLIICKMCVCVCLFWGNGKTDLQIDIQIERPWNDQRKCCRNSNKGILFELKRTDDYYKYVDIGIALYIGG